LIEELKRYGLRVGLLFIDVDNFKQVNDTLGHQTGDALLSMVAQTIVNNLRPFDITGRWGGEEFVCVIRNIDLQGICELGERLRFLIEHSFITVNEQAVRVTVSIGATLIQVHDTMTTVIQRADALMYQSKQQGKNRIIADGCDGHAAPAACPL
jgi:diguanylate cyclase (GGDEF)-like protein